jgi:hypothetical protein
MRLFFILPLIFLTACSIVPVKREFPKLPPILEQKCTDLEEIPTTTKKLSDLVTIVVNNYYLYHECQLKVDAWVEWYSTQKKIFDSVK